MPEEVVTIPKPQMVDILTALDASRREMDGTARLLGTQHAAIVALSGALRKILAAPTELEEDRVRTEAWATLEQWGAQEEAR